MGHFDLNKSQFQGVDPRLCIFDLSTTFRYDHPHSFWDFPLDWDSHSDWDSQSYSDFPLDWDSHSDRDSQFYWNFPFDWYSFEFEWNLFPQNAM